jgi:outer membrane usher protein
LQPGPYDFTNLEDFTGLRNVEVRIRDASGVRSVVRIPYYFTERLLAAGLTDFNVSWGAQRQSAFGDTYGTGAFSAFVHHGITDRVTIGAEAQASSGYAFAALAGAARFDRVGVFALDVGAQRLEDGDVHVADVFNWHYTRGGTTLRALTRGYGDGYRTSSAPPVPGALELPRREVALGWDEALYGSVLLSLNASERRFKVQATQRDYGASLSAGLRSWGNVIISAQRSCASHQCTTQAAASLSIPFGAHHSVNAGWRRDVEGANTTYLQASRSVPTGEGYGWRVNAQDSQGARDLAADGTLRLTQGVLTGAVRRTTFDDGSSSEGWSTGLEGSLACVGSSCYLTQPITDAFAVVDLNGVEGVRVSRNNEVIGRSGASGEVLVSSAPALTRNDIAIFDEDVPISIAVLRNTHLLVPAQGVGYRVRFDLRPILAIRGTLVREQEGRRVPIENVELIVRGEGADPIRARTAGAGFFEIDQLEAGRYVITADLTEGPCVVFVDVPPTRETVHRVGEIACEIVAY